MTQHLSPAARRTDPGSYPIGNAVGSAALSRSRGGDSLADVLERVLDKGVVIVGDIGVSVLDIELLSLKVRLLIASADTARSMGIDWWTADPFLNGDARRSSDENRELRRRVAELERRVTGAPEGAADADATADSPAAATPTEQGAEPEHQEAGR